MFDPNKDSFRALSSAYGKIEEVLLTFPGNTSGDKVKVSQLLHEYEGVWKSINNRVKFYVLANHEKRALHALIGPDFEAALDQLEDSQNYELIPIVADMLNDTSGLPPTNRQFAQDAFLIINDDRGNRAILESYNFKTKGDRDVAEMLAAQTDFVIQPTRYDLEGGNILIGDDYAIVGADTFEKNLHFFESYSRPQQEKLLRRHMKRVFGVSYLIVPKISQSPKTPNYGFSIGDGLQALYHLDLYCTLGGRHPEQNKELIYIGNLVPYLDPDHENHPRGFVEHQGEFNSLKKALDDTAKFFDAYNKEEPGPKFEVVRVPLVFQHIPNGKPLLRSYNNCLVEYYEGRRVFYLPKYDEHDRLIKHDRSNERRVQSMFRSNYGIVIWVNGNFSSLAKQVASLHCITKVLKRSI